MSKEDIPGTTPGNTEEMVLDSAVSSANGVDSSASPTDQTPDVKTDASSVSEAPKDVKTEKPISMLDKVKSILGVNKDKAAADASAAESEKKDSEQDVEAAKAAEAKPAEGKKADEKSVEVPKEFAKHPAWQRILKERDTYKGESEQYRQIQGFLDKTGVSGTDAAKSLQMADLIYNNPQEAYKQLTQIVGDLAVRIGAALPADLQKDVEEGHLSQDRAKELSVARMNANIATQKAEATEEKLVQVDDAHTFSERARTFDAWVDAASKTDPDIAKKLPFLVGALKNVTERDGDATSNDEALARLNAAYVEVNNQIRDLIPARQSKVASPRSGASSATVKTQPTTMLDAVQARLNKSRRV